MDVAGVKNNPKLERLINELKVAAYENKAPIWKDLALRLEGPARNYAEVNLSKLNRVCKKDEFILVPGKVLAAGALDKALNVAALTTSKEARQKIESVGGKVMEYHELIAENPKGTNVRIIG
jgi:large subunit ribosomal protein L18e